MTDQPPELPAGGATLNDPGLNEGAAEGSGPMGPVVQQGNPAADLAAANAALLALEAPKHARDLAGVMVGRTRLLHALGAATPDEVQAKVAAHQAAIQAHAEANVDPHDIDVAAQAVLDAREKLGSVTALETGRSGDQP
jgi:hypothetical protein